MFIPNTGYAFESFVEKTAAIHSQERLFEVFVEAMLHFGFDRLNFSVIHDRQLPSQVHGFGLISTYPEEWQNAYVEQNFAKIDPVLRSASALIKPFSWRELERHQPLNSQQTRFFRQAEEAGLRNGLGIPFNGARTQIAGIALATSHRSGDYMRNRDLLAAFANQFYASFKRLMGLANPVLPSMSPLSPREIEILQLIAHGKTDDAIADALSISDNTVSYYLRRIFDKLNTTNRVQAIVVAIASGLVEL